MSDFHSPRAWLARLAFSLLILAIASGWRSHTLRAAGDRGWRPQAWFGGAIVCGVLGAAGVGVRHSRPKR